MNKQVNTNIEIKNPKAIFTEQEIRIIRLISLGNSSKEISTLLNIRLRTVDAHRRNILDKLTIKNSVGIMIYAISNYLIDLDELPIVTPD